MMESFFSVSILKYQVLILLKCIQSRFSVLKTANSSRPQLKLQCLKADKLDSIHGQPMKAIGWHYANVLHYYTVVFTYVGCPVNVQNGKTENTF